MVTKRAATCPAVHPELSDRKIQILYMVFKSEFGVKNQSKEFGFIYYFNSRVSQKDVRVREKSILLVKVDAHSL